MTWADGAIAVLLSGRTATVKPHGSSMTPRIKSGQTVVIQPVSDRTPEKGDVVLVKVRGTVYLHLVTAATGDRFRISNNHGHDNGWVEKSAIYGIANV